ncbi:hypothetical protein [Nannocystis sp. SCPEA4]|uniref:hypothetical protein n=1 Tax=Nannocystis sp. SCPEA4 TaxID=2996787 RepID=UPI00226E749B|nr:hypothetical protein [Nannocystis sp. SCPEA4]MCY1056025.1 hypothetical protein [Nannocystis sp. SCPEA4]
MATTKKPLDLTPLLELVGQPCGELHLFDMMSRWRTLVALAGEASWDRAAGQWLPALQRHLDEDWPDALRVWPHAWLRRKHPPAAQRVVRHLLLGEQSEAAHRAMFERLGEATADAMPPLRMLSIHRGQKVARRAPVSDLSPADAAALVRALGHTPLCRLRLSGPTRAFWDALLGSALPARLEHLDLALGVNDDLGVEEELGLAEALLAAASALRSIKLSWQWRRGARYSDALVEQLVRHAPTLADVEFVADLDEPAHLAALCAADWPALTTLKLGGRAPQPLDAIHGLLQRALRLHTLDLQALAGASAGVLPPRASAPPASLRRLTIALDGTDPDALAALLASPELAGLTSLRAPQPPPHAALWHAVCALPLEQLTIVCNPHQYDGGAPQLDALLERPIATLRHLGTPCDDLDKLARLELPALRSLNVQCLRFDEAAMQALAASPLVARLDAPVGLTMTYEAVRHTPYTDGARLERFAPPISARIV